MFWGCCHLLKCLRALFNNQLWGRETVEPLGSGSAKLAEWQVQEAVCDGASCRQKYEQVAVEEVHQMADAVQVAGWFKASWRAYMRNCNGHGSYVVVAAALPVAVAAAGVGRRGGGGGGYSGHCS